MRVGLAMIVRDAEAQLPACLESAAPLVDEMVVADTGSRDATRARARAAGARVIEIPWQDDFAQARNIGLQALTSDWVLVLDADERLEAGDGWRGQITAGGCDAYQLPIRNYMRSAGARVWDLPAQPNQPGPAAARWPEIAAYPAWIEHQNVRLFRRCPDLYFVGRVHESVGPRVRAAGLRLGEGPGRIHHFGLALEPEAQAAKNRFYRELGRRKLAERPDDAQAHFELGLMEFENFSDNAAALRCFEQALRRKPDFALAWLFGGAALLRLCHAPEAEAFLDQAARLGYDSPRLRELQGDAYYDQGRYPAAAERYRAAADAAPSESLSGKLGLAELRSGRHHSGLRRLRQVVAAAPDRPDHYDRLVAACVLVEDWEAACATQQARVERFPDQPEAKIRLAALINEVARHRSPGAPAPGG